MSIGYMLAYYYDVNFKDKLKKIISQTPPSNLGVTAVADQRANVLGGG